MPPGKDLFPSCYVLSYAGDVLERMELSRGLQYTAPQYGILKHHHSIVLSRNRHASPDGLKSLQKYRSMGTGALGLLGSNRKAVHGGAIKSGKV